MEQNERLLLQNWNILQKVAYTFVYVIFYLKFCNVDTPLQK